VPSAYNEVDWFYVAPGTLPDWAPWSVGVKIQEMPDGQLAIIGIRVEPHDEYDGKMRDQKLSTAKMRTLPLRILLAQAAVNFAVMNADDRDLESKVHEQLRALDEYEIDRAFELSVKENGPEMARLERVANLYRNAQRWPGYGGPRDQIAEALGVSKVTVDRQLQESRKQGFLVAFDGKQGKHGERKTEGK